jgi:hypothetical protein
MRNYKFTPQFEDARHTAINQKLATEKEAREFAWFLRVSHGKPFKFEEADEEDRSWYYQEHRDGVR